MPYEKVYFEEGKNPLDDEYVIIHITKNNGLYVEVGRGTNGCEIQNIVLGHEDALEIVKELASDLGYVLSQNTTTTAP